MAEGLTARRQKFCARMAAHGNATRAAEEAGFRHPNKIGPALVKQPVIAAELKRLRARVQAARDRTTIANAIEIQEHLTRIMRGEEKEVELTLSGDAVERKGTLETRRKASMDLAKIQGLFADRVVHSGAIALAELSFRELLELAKLGGDE